MYRLKKKSVTLHLGNICGLSAFVHLSGLFVNFIFGFGNMSCFNNKPSLLMTCVSHLKNSTFPFVGLHILRSCCFSVMGKLCSLFNINIIIFFRKISSNDGLDITGIGQQPWLLSLTFSQFFVVSVANFWWKLLSVNLGKMKCNNY